jgi:hypothetical protein
MTRTDLTSLNYEVTGLRDAIDRGSLILAEHYCERLERVLRELDPARETVATCEACRGTGFVYCYGDSGTWVVESCHEGAKGAERCPCNGHFDRWVA